MKEQFINLNALITILTCLKLKSSLCGYNDDSVILPNAHNKISSTLVREA